MSENELFIAEMKKLSKDNIKRLEREERDKLERKLKPLIGIKKALWNVDEINRLVFQSAGGGKWKEIKVLIEELKKELDGMV